MDSSANWSFHIASADQAAWSEGLRTIFEYRDLGMKDATDGDYIAHVIRRKGGHAEDDVQQWHIHECRFQMVYVLRGWATFEYEGEGERTIRAGDCINQRPMIRHRELACSEDFEVLEIVSPANFRTVVVDAPGDS